MSLGPTTTAGVGESLWAHHAALVAIPAFVPAVVVVAVILYIARKDRQDEAHERELIERAFEPEPHDTPDDTDEREQT